jgi:hypothetical protein
MEASSPHWWWLWPCGWGYWSGLVVLWHPWRRSKPGSLACPTTGVVRPLSSLRWCATVDVVSPPLPAHFISCLRFPGCNVVLCFAGVHGAVVVLRQGPPHDSSSFRVVWWDHTLTFANALTSLGDHRSDVRDLKATMSWCRSHSGYLACSDLQLLVLHGNNWLA